MSEFRIQSPDTFKLEFEKLVILYKDVKNMIILAENVMGKFPLALTNELRNSYDHVLRIAVEKKDFFKNEEDAKKETVNQFVSAGRHLKRAGYDACEFIIVEYLDEIKSILKRYKSKDVSQILGKDYVNIKSFVKQVETKNLVEARSLSDLNVFLRFFKAPYLRPIVKYAILRAFNWYVRQTARAYKNSKIKIENDVQIDSLYHNFLILIKKADEWRDKLLEYEDTLIEYQKDQKMERIKQVIISIVIGLLLIVVSYFIGSNNVTNTDNLTKPQSSQE